MKYRSLMLLFLLLLCIGLIERDIPNITLPTVEIKASSKIYFNRTNLGIELPEYVLVAITNHECYANAQITERIFMMEAVWNRVQDNFGNHGLTLSDQLFAPKQFTGLFIYRPSAFCINFNTPNNQYLISLARKIIYEHKRLTSKRIYYWAGTCDSDGAHGKWVRKNKLRTLIQTKNIFA